MTEDKKTIKRMSNEIHRLEKKIERLESLLDNFYCQVAFHEKAARKLSKVWKPFVARAIGRTPEPHTINLISTR